MATSRRALSLLVALFAALLALGNGCSDNGSPRPTPSPGKITAKADGIQGQNGKLYSVTVYEADWYPGATLPAVAGLRETISSDNYSSLAALRTLDPGGSPTSEAKSFAPGQYSVVFFVSVPGSPPQFFAEVRATVDGDITATAPAWANWVRP